MQKLFRSLFAIGVVAGLAACGDDVTVTPPPEPVPPTVTAVSVSGPATIMVGESAVFSANVTTNGTGVNTDVTWSSGNASIASVSGAGSVTGVAAGQTTITATSVSEPTVHGSAAVTVVAPGVQNVSVTPSSAMIAVGQTTTAVATVTRDAGVAGTVTWSTSASAIATVNSSTGVITAVSPGTAVITATSTVDNSKSGSMSVTVTAQQNGVTALSVTPTQATIGIGATLNTSTSETHVNGATVTITSASSNPAIATVSASGANPTITAVGSGTAVITVTATASNAPAGYANNSITATVTVNVVSAQVSIASITAGGIPVIISSVAGQIDVNLNFDPQGLGIDSVVVRILQPGGPKRAAKQNFGNTVPAAGILQLSINTANYAKNAAAGTALVDYFNGQTTISAQVYPHSGSGATAVNCSNSPGDPTCASPIQLVLANVDGWAADITKPTASAKVNVGGAAATLGATYWGGPGAAGVTSAEIYPVIYNNNPDFASGSALNRCSNQNGDGTGCISTVTWTVGTPAVGTDGTCSTVTQTAVPFVRTFGSGGQTACVYQNTVLLRDNIVITAAIDGTNNPFPTVGTPTGLPLPANPNTTLISNAIVFGSTPDSLRLDYVGPAVTMPQVGGAEAFNWVNANWSFKPGGTIVTDGGVGPLASSWAAFASANGGSATVFPTAVATGADLAETNTNCLLPTAGCDGYTLRATATDLLLNPANSGVTAGTGDDQTSPLLRYSATTAPSSFAAIYTAGGPGTTLDSTTYNAVQGVYGANVVAAGANTLFLAAAAGTNDSVRVEAIDNRSGLSRAIENTLKFAQGGAMGATTALVGNTTTGAFLASLVDGWRPAPAFHVTNGNAGGAPPATPGYYTTTEYVVDRAGNVSGCPVSGNILGTAAGAPVASVCTAAAPNTASNTNPAMGVGPAGTNANLYYRRTVALDPGQPAVTGVSPNNSYTGNSSQTWSLGSQDDLEVIDARLRIMYPNVTIGDLAATLSNGLVWSYALSNTFMAADGMPSGPFSAGPASGNGVNFGFFSPIATRFDNSVVNPQVTALTQDQFTLNVQETCTAAAPGAATGPTASCGTATAPAVGDPIPVVDVPATIPTGLAVQVRDVFGSWVFNSSAGGAFGVSAEFASPILPATVAAPGSYSVTYAVLAPGCPQGGGAPGGPCVTAGINFRADGAPSASVRDYRSVQPLSVTLPVFSRVELYGLNAANEWVFIQRCSVPTTIIPNAGAQACTNGGGTVNGTDNGLERYWVYSFTGIPTAGFTQFRALGVNSSGFGLFSTIQP